MVFYRFELHAPLTPPELLRRLRGVSYQHARGWSRLFSLAPPGTAFIGEVTADSFKLQRHIRYRNAYLPQIRGQISGEGDGSRMQVSMSLHPWALALTVLWLFLTLRVLLNVALVWQGHLIPAGFVLFGIALILVCFWLEVSRARCMLAELCEAPRQANDSDKFPISLL